MALYLRLRASVRIRLRLPRYDKQTAAFNFLDRAAGKQIAAFNFLDRAAAFNFQFGKLSIASSRHQL
jgi:hypothetical protein